MRLLTFQDKFVLDTIEYKKELGKFPIYECEKVNFTHKEEKLYNKFIHRMKEKLDIPMERIVLPIWAWVVPKNQEIDDEYLTELYDRMIPKCDHLVAIELDVPKELVFISNFNEWYELKFKCIFNKDDAEEIDIDSLFKKQKGAVLQAALPFIDEAFIVNYKDYNSYVDKDYSKTDSEIKELKKKGYLDKDPSGWV